MYLEVFLKGKASAALLASLLHDAKVTPAIRVTSIKLISLFICLYIIKGDMLHSIVLYHPLFYSKKNELKKDRKVNLALFSFS